MGLIITKVISGFKLLKAGFLLAKGALTPLISSVWSFTAALLANPVTWIVIGIVALIAALVLLAAGAQQVRVVPKRGQRNHRLFQGEARRSS